MEVGSSLVMSQCEEAGKAGVGEEGKGSPTVGFGLLAAPEVLVGGLPSLTSLAWVVEPELQRNLLMETQPLMKSWRSYLHEKLGQICSPGSPPSLAFRPGSHLMSHYGWRKLSVGLVEDPSWWILWTRRKATSL